MAFNGSGVFVRLYNWVNDAAANIKIRADRMDGEMDGFATGLTTCITKDGQTTPTANLPMGGFHHINVSAGSDRAHYASIGQTQDGLINWVAAGGTADAITAGYSIPLTALVDGQVCYIRASAANTTTTPTFSPSGLTAHTITKIGGTALAVGDIKAAGHEIILRYNLANTRWEFVNAGATVTDATITTSDVTTNNVTSVKHGWAPKSPGDATKFINGAASPDYASVKDSDLAFTDIATNNASTAKHGLMPKLSNSATLYFDSLGTQTNPALNAVLTGFVSGAGTVASTDTVLQAIQKLNGNTSATPVQISTASPTGVATSDASSIPQTYHSIVMVWSGISSNTATRKHTLSIDIGAGYVDANVSIFGFNNTSGTVTGTPLIVGNPVYSAANAATAAQTTRGFFLITNYAQITAKTYALFMVDGTGAASMQLGIIPTATSIVGIRHLWDSTGNFDAGTWTLYGIN